MVTLSQKELQRMRVIEKTVDGRLSVREAAGLLQRSERQVQRLKSRYQADSVDWAATAMVVKSNLGLCRRWCASRCWIWPVPPTPGSTILTCITSWSKAKGSVSVVQLC